VLRDLDLLITSRYHACVLSMEAGVPQTAIGHDLRLQDIYQESGIMDEFFLSSKDPELWARLRERVDRLVREHDALRQRMLEVHEAHLARARENVRLLRRFCSERKIPVV
jgi:polysaccharide pyruvyl transferase WcaK-like protein